MVFMPLKLAFEHSCYCSVGYDVTDVNLLNVQQ